MQRFGNTIRALLRPDRPRCIGCGEPSSGEEDWLCERCQEKIEKLDLLNTPRCPRCGAPWQEGGCPICRDWPERAVSAAVYRYGFAAPLDSVIHQMKYRGAMRVAEWMGDDVAELIRHEGMDDCDLLVPVPMHPARLRERGHNQARTIAEAVSIKTGKVLLDALVRVVNTRQQTRLAGDVRRQNLREAIAPAAGMNVKGKSVLLIDDVSTTGTTMNVCAAALWAAGAREVRAAAFAGSIWRPAR